MDNHRQTSEIEYDFHEFSDLELVVLRKSAKDFGDAEFVRSIDDELKKRIEKREQL